MTENFTLRVNGVEREVIDAWIGENLLYVLRERLGLPGAKNACEQGECGACSVVIDDTLMCSCLVPAAVAVGAEIITIESLGNGGALSTVQQAFVDAGAVQCGFCTPGLVMTTHDLLTTIVLTGRIPDATEVREAIAGNLCRCTGYGRVLDAIERAIATTTASDTP